MQGYYKLIITIGLLFFIQLCFAEQTLVSAELSENKIALNETVQLTVTARGKNIKTQPSFSMLKKDFTILSQGQSSEIRVINGNTNTSNKWLITLAPIHTGEIKIANIKFAGTNLKTNTLKLTVTEASTHKENPGELDNYFLRTEVSSDKPLVQSQFTYTVKLFFNQNIHELREIEPVIEDSSVFHIDKDKSYDKMLNNKAYRVIEQRYAVIPQKSGPLTINSPIFTGSVVNTKTNSQNLFTSNFQPIRITSTAITINVQAIPAQAEKNWWLPAKNLKLSETWSEKKPQFKVGEPITRTITLQSAGLTAEQLPAIKMENIAQTQIYSDKAKIETSTDGDNLIAKRTEKFAIIPNQAGELKFPRIDIKWWDTDKNQARVAILPAHTYSVAAGTLLKPSINSAIPTVKNLQVQNTTPTNIWQTFWPWLVLGLIMIWLFTLLLWWRSKTKKSINQKKNTKQNSSSLRQAKYDIKQACATNNQQQVKAAILAWASITNPSHTFRSLTDLIKQTDNAIFKLALQQLNQSLYTKQPTDWHGLSFWQQIEKHLQLRKPDAGKSPAELPELYPED